MLSIKPIGENGKITQDEFEKIKSELEKMFPGSYIRHDRYDYYSNLFVDCIRNVTVKCKVMIWMSLKSTIINLYFYDVINDLRLCINLYNYNNYVTLYFIYINLWSIQWKNTTFTKFWRL